MSPFSEYASIYKTCDNFEANSIIMHAWSSMYLLIAAYNVCG